MTTYYILTAICLLFAIATATLYLLDKNRLAGCCKMIASIAFIANCICAINYSSLVSAYGYLILSALIMALSGDSLLMIKELVSGKTEKFYLYGGVSSFYLCQILLIIAFIARAESFQFAFLPLCFIMPAIMLASYKTKLVNFNKDGPFMVFYAIVLSLTMVCAINMYYQIRSTFALVAMIGSICFAISDNFLGLYYFGVKGNKRVFNFPVMIFYYAAQCLYILSIML